MQPSILVHIWNQISNFVANLINDKANGCYDKNIITQIIESIYNFISTLVQLLNQTKVVMMLEEEKNIENIDVDEVAVHLLVDLEKDTKLIAIASVKEIGTEREIGIGTEIETRIGTEIRETAEITGTEIEIEIAAINTYRDQTHQFKHSSMEVVKVGPPTSLKRIMYFTTLEHNAHIMNTNFLPKPSRTTVSGYR